MGALKTGHAALAPPSKLMGLLTLLFAGRISLGLHRVSGIGCVQHATLLVRGAAREARNY
jgi:hypothetical protein